MKILITEKQFESIISNILFEQKGDEVYNKYYSDIDKNKAIELLKLDNKSKVNGNDIIYIGLGAKILFAIQRNGDIMEEDYPKAELYVSLINKYNIKYDKRSIKYLPDLYRLVKKYMLDVNAPLDLILEELPSNEYDKVYDGPEWVIFIPKTERASCWLGVNTQWCTTYGKYSLNKEFKDKDKNKFEDYNREGFLYIIINKNNEKEKYQFHFEIGEFMDNENDEIKLKEFYRKNEEVRKYFGTIEYKLLLSYDGGDLDLEESPIEILPPNITKVDGHLKLQHSQIISLGELKHVDGFLNLRSTPIESLGNLEQVEEWLDLLYTPIKSLGNLEYVGGYLVLQDTPIESLDKLGFVGGYLALTNTPITSLGNLKGVFGNLHLTKTQIQSLDNLEYVSGHIYIRDTPLIEKYSIEELEEMYPKFKGKFVIL